jgi:hypothetical protein
MYCIFHIIFCISISVFPMYTCYKQNTYSQWDRESACFMIWTKNVLLRLLFGFPFFFAGRISFFISTKLIIIASLFHLKADTVSTTFQVDICVFVFDIMFCNGQRYAWKKFFYKKVLFVDGSPLSCSWKEAVMIVSSVLHITQIYCTFLYLQSD